MAIQPLHTQHPRQFEGNKFVYPVLSRRSQGISVGVNLNPDKVCNFDCVYCQVDRTTQAAQKFVELDRLVEELTDVLQLVHSGGLYQHPKFSKVPSKLRRLNDIAFSGDGEPTTFVNFDEVIQRCAEVKKQLKLDSVRMVLITNASMLHKPRVQAGLQTLDANQGEIWAKLDAGTPAYYRQVMRTVIPFDHVLANLTSTAQRWPIVIQTLFCKIAGQGPDDAEIAAYCDRLEAIQHAGGAILRIQIYTVARPPAESQVAALEDARVDQIVAAISARLKLPVEGYYGASDRPLEGSTFLG